MPGKTIDSMNPIVKRLRRLEQEAPDLRQAARIYAAILPLLHSADLDAGPVSLTASEIRMKMLRGSWLLQGVDIDFDMKAMQKLLTRLVSGIETANGKLRFIWQRATSRGKRETALILTALEKNELNIASLLSPGASSGSTSGIAAQNMIADSKLLRTLAQNALIPALRAWCRQLSPLARGVPWNKRVCFVCGAAATLGELQGNDQARHLRCGSCGADWQFRRLQCVNCGNEDHESQRYLYAENERDRMRVEVCDRCKGYLKVISAFTPTPPEMLAVEDLATIHLDYIAQERGYARVPVQ